MRNLPVYVCGLWAVRVREGLRHPCERVEQQLVEVTHRRAAPPPVRAVSTVRPPRLRPPRLRPRRQPRVVDVARDKRPKGGKHAPRGLTATARATAVRATAVRAATLPLHRVEQRRGQPVVSAPRRAALEGRAARRRPVPLRMRVLGVLTSGKVLWRRLSPHQPGPSPQDVTPRPAGQRRQRLHPRTKQAVWPIVACATHGRAAAAYRRRTAAATAAARLIGASVRAIPKAHLARRGTGVRGETGAGPSHLSAALRLTRGYRGGRQAPHHHLRVWAGSAVHPPPPP